MITFLLRHFIKEYEQTQNPAVRERYGVLAGAVGILLNLCLFAAKFIAGLLTASIAVTADAFNNLSDAGSSVVTLVGFKMAGRPADREHPFGHGRIEYVAGLAVSMAILLVGVELLKGSFTKILHPQRVAFSLVSFGILVLSVLVKCWMCYFNRNLGKRIDSTAMKATAMDSLTDAVATSAVALGALAEHFTNWQADGWIGLLVALFILYSGWNTAKDSLSPLLGQTPDASFVQEIACIVLAHEEIIGLHDLIVHDYGPGRCIISLHAEIPCDRDILIMHDAIDLIEMELREKFHCDVTIHMDPIAVNDEETMAIYHQVKAQMKEIDAEISIHDFRMVKGPTHTNLIFEATIPFKFRLTDAQVAQQIRQKVRALGKNYFAVVTVEKSYT